ncbi:MAG: acyltransferase [Stackebrandtia sp.]
MTVHATAAQQRPPASARPRSAFIDNLRILLTALVVIHHAAVTYGNIPVSYYLEPAKDPSGAILDGIVMINQTFFMGFFFMISGFFVPGSYDRKGPKAFWRGRLKRLGIPLLLFILVMRPLLTLWLYKTELADKVPYWLFYIASWDPGPMWFVEVLLAFCLGYLLIRRIRGEAAPVLADSGAGRLPGPLPIAGFVLALTLVTFAWRQLVPAEAYWPVLGLPTPTFLPQYLGLFIVGVLAARRGWFTDIPRPALWWGGVLTAVSGAARLVTIAMFPEPNPWQDLLSYAVECGFAVSAIVFLLALFQRFANGRNATTRFLSDNAYGVYFLHMGVLVGVGLALRGWEASAIAKFAVLVLIALPLSWGAAALLRRIPAARRIF